MVDLQSQYVHIKKEIDEAIQEVLNSAAFINGPQVKAFADELATYLDVPHVIPCANGTDALQIALMGLGLKAGDEVIVPAFTYAAAIEVIVLLGMTPVLVDVDPDTFNIDAGQIEQTVSSRTKAIVVVHLFGQCCDMERVLNVANKYNLFVVEDNAQSLGATYTFSNRKTKKAGTIGHISTTSFFPTKPLGAYGDGGALITSDSKLAERVRCIANHGQKEKFHHRMIGCNSRLDTLQAAILRVKLRHIDTFTETRRQIALRYDEAFHSCTHIIPPYRASYSSHVYHQYTLRISNAERNDLKDYLHTKGIPSAVYYPLSIQEQTAFRVLVRTTQPVMREAARLSRSVLSIPIHSEMDDAVQNNIINAILGYGKKR
ncbi:MAG: DegT/DnrJ/EryC1/StrS family aminotransferase [Tannerellaceae bacterium]|jgi:dTDP-4-amino-4,6-dideoxygalactose transaminase|nr:DegT/DnrJ/EryC1/StrS family aminotransferase [Tannerellaceae bacterium]